MSAPLFTTRDFCGLVYRLLNPLVSPGGCRVSWLFFKARATAVRRLPDRLRINLDMRPPRALPAAHFDRNERYAYFGARTQDWAVQLAFLS